MVSVARVFAAIKASKQIPVFLNQVRVIVSKIDGNAWFLNPWPDLALVSKHLDDLEEAERFALHGPQGAAQERNVKLGVVRSDVRQLKVFVQSICDAHPAEARAIIESAGFTIAKSTARRPKPPFAVKYGKVPGRVLLEAKAVAKWATYYWQMSTNQEDWRSLPETHQASTSVDGLTAATRFYFRFRALSKTGMSDWSMVISILAH